MTTHSPFVLYEMDKVSLIRIYKEASITSASYFYTVPQDYETNRKMLNRCLTEAIFANKVLLVEGPSELLLFEKVLSVVYPFYETDGIYILSVEGLGFKRYVAILDGLNIVNIIKTDNDLRLIKCTGQYFPLGFSRCNKMIGSDELPTDSIDGNNIEDRRELYLGNQEKLDELRLEYGIFLSKVDLENDLDEFLHKELVTYLGVKDPVTYLQKAKHFHMVELVRKISDDDCRKIFEHYNFACLKEIVE